jgi:PadR family transcriptional regulator PadR
LTTCRGTSYFAGGVSEATYYVLAALLDERLHGYGIIKKVAALSGGAVKLTTGTLYGALDRLVGQGLVAPDGEERVEGRLRRYYRITEAGAEDVRAEAERMRRAVRAVGRRRAAVGRRRRAALGGGAR